MFKIMKDSYYDLKCNCYKSICDEKFRDLYNGN